jgi:hypothetical protein
MFRKQPCRICRRVTWHKVDEAHTEGDVVEVATCMSHHTYSNGQIDVRNPRTGQWTTVRPPKAA